MRNVPALFEVHFAKIVNIVVPPLITPLFPSWRGSMTEIILPYLLTSQLKEVEA